MLNHARVYISSRVLVVCGCVLALSVLMLGGCGVYGEGTSGDTSVTDTLQTSSDSYENPFADFDFSEGLDENGLWDGIKALDLVDLCNYIGIQIPEGALPSDEDVQAQIESFLQSNVSDVEVYNRPVVDGDTLIIDYVGSIDGVEFEGGSTDGKGTAVTIGVTQYIDDFLEQLIGHTPGDRFDVEVTFPNDYPAQDLAGKDAVFDVTINYIVESQTPELTDEWVESIGAAHDWKSVDDLRAAFTEQLRDAAVAEYVTQYVMDESRVEGDVPQEIVEYQEGFLVQYFQDYADAVGVSLADIILMMTGAGSIDELMAQSQPQVEEAARQMLVYQAIAEDAGLSIDEDQIATYMTDYVGSDDLEAFTEVFGLPYLKFSALMQAVDDLLVENAVLPDADAISE